MIEVELPDGTIIEFPDGTSPDVMKSALSKLKAPEAKRGPDGMTTAERIARAKAGTLAVSPQSERATQAANAKAMTAMNDPGQMATALLGATQGATFGFGDELVAGLAGLTGGDYQQALSLQRNALAAGRETSPVTAYGSELAGGILSPASAVGSGWLAGANTLGSAAARGAVIGAGQGAAYGAGAADGGLADRVQGAATGATIGAGVGAAVPVIARGAGAAKRGISDYMAERGGQAQIAKDLGVSRQAAAHVADTLGADDMAALRQSVAQAGPDAMLADASPAVQGALDAAMQRPGTASRLGMERIEGRAAQANTKIAGALDTALGAPQGAETGKAAIRAGTSGARNAAYDAAYSAPIDYSADAGRALEGLLPRIPSKAFNDANLLMKMEGETSSQIIAKVADDGSVVLETLPDVRQWDYIKRALDFAASSGEGQGALGGQTAMGRAYQGLARSVRDNLKTAVPEYSTALDTAADAISRVKGIETGYALLRPGTTREAAKEAVSGATGPEIAAIKQGMRDYLDDTLANVRAVVSDPNLDAREARKALGEMSSRAAQDKIKAVLGNDADALLTAIDEASKALGLRASVAQNSKTAARLAFKERSEELAKPGVVASALSIRPVEAARTLAGRFLGTTPEATARRTDRINAELVDVLTRQGRGDALQALAAIEAAMAQNAPNALAGRGTTRSINMLSAPAVQQSVGGVNYLMGR